MVMVVMVVVVVVVVVLFGGSDNDDGGDGDADDDGVGGGNGDDNADVVCDANAASDRDGGSGDGNRDGEGDAGGNCDGGATLSKPGGWWWCSVGKSSTVFSPKIPIAFPCIGQSPSLFLPTNNLLSKIFLRRLLLVLVMEMLMIMIITHSCNELNSSGHLVSNFQVLYVRIHPHFASWPVLCEKMFLCCFLPTREGEKDLAKRPKVPSPHLHPPPLPPPLLLPPEKVLDLDARHVNTLCWMAKNC